MVLDSVSFPGAVIKYLDKCNLEKKFNAIVCIYRKAAIAAAWKNWLFNISGPSENEGCILLLIYFSLVHAQKMFLFIIQMDLLTSIYLANEILHRQSQRLIIKYQDSHSQVAV